MKKMSGSPPAEVPWVPAQIEVSGKKAFEKVSKTFAAEEKS